METGRNDWAAPEPVTGNLTWNFIIMSTPPKKKWRIPRNPLVVPSLQRKAGSHRKGQGTERQQSARTLRREIQQLH